MTTVDLIFSTKNHNPNDDKTRGLNGNKTILLMLSPIGTDKLYKDVQPLAWKVLTFSKGQSQDLPVTFNASLGFAQSSISSENIVSAGVKVEVKLGDKVTLTNNGGFWEMSAPVSMPGSKLMKLVNGSHQQVNVSAGLFNKDNHEYEQVLTWRDVSAGDGPTIQFTPTLRIYATSEYKETELLRGDIESSLLGEWDLAKLWSRADPIKVNKFIIWQDSKDGFRLKIDGGENGRNMGAEGIKV